MNIANTDNTGLFLKNSASDHITVADITTETKERDFIITGLQIAAHR
jgi:hypothetical protein